MTADVSSTGVSEGCTNVIRVVNPTGFKAVSATLVRVGIRGSVVDERFSFPVPVVKRLFGSVEINLTV